MLEAILKEYKRLKNDSGTKTSLIRDYYQKKGISWEKEPIKTQVIGRKAQSPYEVSDEFAFVRALLGLAELYDYPKGRNTGKAKVADLQNEINRFGSPITFKVYKNTLYLLAKPIPDRIFGREFAIYLVESGVKEHEESTNKIHIPTPSKASFSWEDFLGMPENAAWKALGQVEHNLLRLPVQEGMNQMMMMNG